MSSPNRCNRLPGSAALLLVAGLWPPGELRAGGPWQEVSFTRHPAGVDIAVGGRPFTFYYYRSPAAKAYLMPLRTASGAVISRDFPHGNDIQGADAGRDDFEPHQRPLYFGHGDISGVDFWNEAVFQRFYDSSEASAQFGRMVFLRLEQLHAGAGVGRIRVRFLLSGPEGEKIGDEVQGFAFRGDAHARIIDCAIRIEAAYGRPVHFGDTKEGSFALRFNGLLSDPAVQIVNSERQTGAQVWGQRAAWVVYSGTVQGESVRVGVFDDPRNFNHPTRWHARGYGLLSANPFGSRCFAGPAAPAGGFTIPAGGSLLLRYRVYIYHGAAQDFDPGRAYGEYLREAGLGGDGRRQHSRVRHPSLKE